MTKRKTHDEFKKEMFEAVKLEYTLLEKYVNNSTKVLVRHNICRKEYSVSPSNFIQGYRCPNCSKHGIRMKTQNEFEQEVEALGEGEYSVLSAYNGDSKKVEMMHILCGNRWFVTANVFLQGCRCPKCASSKGERRVEVILNELGIQNYKTQYKIEGCKYDRPLRFDFYLPDYNLLIEYDGIVHYEDRFNNPYGFKLSKKRDKIKTKFCKDNNINLLRIPYWEYKNIKEIVRETLCL